MDERGIAALLLGFGLVAVGAVLYFVGRDRQNTLKTYATLISTGASVQAVDVTPQGVPPIAAAAAALAAAQGVTVEGPATVVVGVPADFTAKQAGAQVVATWAAVPDAATAPLGEPTSRVTVVAKQPGPFTVTATVQGVAPARLNVTAVAADRARQAIPFIGAGWGSVVVAIVLVTVTGALGLVGALTGEGVATIIGALVGYVVSKGQSETGSHPSTSGGGGATPAA